MGEEEVNLPRVVEGRTEAPNTCPGIENDDGS
jgi:hypothetical protein